MKPTKLIQPNQFYLTKSRGENLEKNKQKFVPTLTWAWPSSAPTCYDLFILLKTFFLDGSLWLCAKFEIFFFILALSFSLRQDIGDWYLNRWPWMTVTDKFVLVSESFMQTFMAPFRIFLFLQQLMETQGKFKYQKKFCLFLRLVLLVAAYPGDSRPEQLFVRGWCARVILLWLSWSCQAQQCLIMSLTTFAHLKWIPICTTIAQPQISKFWF